MISDEERKAAKEYFHQDLIKLADMYEREELAMRQKLKHELELKELTAANIAGIDSLFETVIEKDSETANRSVFDYVLLDAFEKFKSKFEETVQDFKRRMMNQYKEKVDEIEETHSAFQQSLDEVNRKSKQLILDFEKKKKLLFKQLKANKNSELLQSFEKERTVLVKELLEMEINQTDAFQEIIDQFKANYKEKDSSELISMCFKNLREIDQKFMEEMKAKLDAESEELKNDQQNRMQKRVEKLTEKGHFEKVKAILEDKELVQGMLTRSQESHQETINQKEEELLSNERRMMQQQLLKASQDEFDRNRNRVMEIWMFADRIREELEEECKK